MNIADLNSQGSHQSQQFHRQYGANALLPTIEWSQLFQNNALTSAQQHALDILYRTAVPLALQVFDELKFDVFSPAAYQPQGLGLFEKIAQQENNLIHALSAECHCLNDETRHQIWSMLLRGGAVLVFKAWLGKVKTNENLLDTTQFDELSDLLFIKTSPFELAQHLAVNADNREDHIFLMYGNDIYLDHFNSLETAALFVDLGVYDAAFLSLRDDSVAEYLKEKSYVSQEQIDDLQCALNPLFCTDLTPKKSWVI